LHHFCVATIKRISGIVNRNVATAFPEKKGGGCLRGANALVAEEQAEIRAGFNALQLREARVLPRNGAAILRA
jgi:hypothetical protein